MARQKKAELERIEDAFFDMQIGEQQRLLNTLQTLHRLKTRQIEREARTETQVLNGEDHAEA